MTNSKQILEDLYRLKKSFPQNPITKLDEVNTILHIYAIREEIAKSKDEQYIEDCKKALKELEIHYKELSRKNSYNYASLYR